MGILNEINDALSAAGKTNLSATAQQRLDIAQQRINQIMSNSYLTEYQKEAQSRNVINQLKIELEQLDFQYKKFQVVDLLNIISKSIR